MLPFSQSAVPLWEPGVRWGAGESSGGLVGAATPKPGAGLREGGKQLLLGPWPPGWVGLSLVLKMGKGWEEKTSQLHLQRAPGHFLAPEALIQSHN